MEQSAVIIGGRAGCSYIDVEVRGGARVGT